MKSFKKLKLLTFWKESPPTWMLLSGALGLSIFLTPVRSMANVVGNSLENFNPNQDGIDFVTVHSWKPLHEGQYHLGLDLDYGVNTLPIFKEDAARNRLKWREGVTHGHLSGAYGITSTWQVGFSLPTLLHSHAKDRREFRGNIASTGVSEYRLGTKWTLLNGEPIGLALGASHSVHNMDGNLYNGSSSSHSTSFDIIAGKDFFGIATVANLGLLHTAAKKLAGSEAPIEPVKNAITWSLAANTPLVAPDYSLIAEIFGSRATKENRETSSRSNSPAEVLVAAKVQLTEEIHSIGGLGTEITHGNGTADWRLFAGVHWTSKNKKAVMASAPSKPPTTYEKVVVQTSILFDFNSDQIRLSGVNQNLLEFANKLKAERSIEKVVVIGHTDSVGQPAYNFALSKRRAEAIQKWMVKRTGISPKLFQPLGRGETQPIATNSTPAGRQENRRVEFRIYRKS